jgi:hypothetical protein
MAFKQVVTGSKYIEHSEEEKRHSQEHELNVEQGQLEKCLGGKFE